VPDDDERSALQICARTLPKLPQSCVVVLPVNADIIVYLFGPGRPHFRRANVGAVVSGSIGNVVMHNRDYAERGYEFQKLPGKVKRYVH